jgi:ABC-type transport system involved in cytochrome c biogenesis permease subunit
VLAIEALLFDFGFLGYLAALGFYLAYAFTRKDRQSDVGQKILFASVAVHGVSLALGLWAEAHRPGHVAYGFWSNWFESLSLFSLLISATFLAVQTRAKLGILGVFVLPWAVLLMGMALTQAFLASPRCPFASVEVFLRMADVGRRLPEIKTTLGAAVHVPLLFFSYAAFANAFGIGLAFLIQERQIKSRRPTPLTYRLPSLDEMDRLMSRLILAAFPALTIGLWLGVRWARAAWTDPWMTDPKVIFSGLVWAVYLVYLLLRYGLGWRGRRTTYLSLAGFALVLVGYLAMNFFSRIHGFLPGTAG